MYTFEELLANKDDLLRLAGSMEQVADRTTGVKHLIQVHVKPLASIGKHDCRLETMSLTFYFTTVQKATEANAELTAACHKLMMTNKDNVN